MKEKVLVIAGPTGVGKTACSIQLAKSFHGEIINGDAMQVYRGLDIGTAKITKDEMETVPHHLIDCFAYDDMYNVKVFQEKGREKITQIGKRDALPIVCGGTGLYIKSLLYDYAFEEQAKDEEFLSFLASLSNAQLYALLKHVDEDACKTIHPHNRQRMVRAIEMAHMGHKKSDVIAQQAHIMLYDAYLIGLTMNRERLYERIDLRVDQMMEHGLYEEVKTLAESNPNIWNCQSFQSIGYKEWQEHFQGKASIADCVKKIKKNSRNFAKRQYTWFRNQLPMHWYDVETPNWIENMIQDVATWLRQ